MVQAPLTDAQGDLSGATSEEEVLSGLETLSQQLDAAAAGTSDTGFRSDVTRVTDA